MGKHIKVCTHITDLLSCLLMTVAMPGSCFYGNSATYGSLTKVNHNLFINIVKIICDYGMHPLITSGENSYNPGLRELMHSRIYIGIQLYLSMNKGHYYYFRGHYQ